ALEATTGKVRGFGGRIETSTADGLVAVFGLEPDEDAPLRAAHAAIAVQKLAARARREAAGLPGAALALHTAPVTLVRAGERVALDADERRAVLGALAGTLARAATGMV